MPHPPIEPFRIKMVEPIRFLTRAERAARLEAAGYNLFYLQSEDVAIDLLTDSGTSAMSQDQWAAMMQGDEAYAGSRSYARFEATVKDLFGFEEVIPTHQGRAAENALCALLVSAGQVVPSNGHFDTTRANVEAFGARALDLADPKMLDPVTDFPFKGDIALDQLERLLEATPREQIPFGMLTVTNNTRAGQPVSMANVRATADLLHARGIPFFLDACRIAENAFFIKAREEGYLHHSSRAIVHEMCSYADGCTMSAKKDGLANIGGFLCVRDAELAERLRGYLIRVEGFPTYGGMTGRDMEAIAVGLEEVVSEDYLCYRTGQTRYLGDLLNEVGVPTFQPAGGHAIYVNAGALLPHIPQGQFPAQALVCEAYLEGGIRSVEIGSVMFGYPDPASGVAVLPALELVRLALPRRVYTGGHLEYVATTFGAIAARRESVRGLELTWSPPVLRHFRAKFRPVG